MARDALRNTLRDTWSGLLDLLYPPRCLACREFGPNVLCDDCRNDFCPLDPPLCDRCGVMVAATRTGLCNGCEERSFFFVQTRAAGRYDGALRKAVIALKYGGKRPLAEPLGRYLADYLGGNPFRGTQPDLIIPIPLHASRFRERGFNQSALLADVVGRELDIPLANDALIRTRKTRPQVELHRSQRQKNVRDAFAVSRPERVKGRDVMLLDDVLTTLHTVDECARMLAAAGARRVVVAGVARGSL